MSLFNPTVPRTLGVVQHYAEAMGLGVASVHQLGVLLLYRQVLLNAAVRAFDDTFLVSTAICVPAIVAALLVRNSTSGARSGPVLIRVSGRRERLVAPRFTVMRRLILGKMPLGRTPGRHPTSGPPAGRRGHGAPPIPFSSSLDQASTPARPGSSGRERASARWSSPIVTPRTSATLGRALSSG